MITLGGNTFGWTSDETASHRVLDAFLDAGGSAVDTAEGYSSWVPGNPGGVSETIIGNWLASRGNRDRVVLATKATGTAGGLTAAKVAAAADASLTRLRTDYVDVYYAHFDDPETPIAETAAAFDAVVRAGKARTIGVSNYDGARLREWFEVARRDGLILPVAVSPHYNLVKRFPYERDVAGVAAAENLAVLPYFGLASGFLTGKYRTADDLKANGQRGSFAEGYLTGEGLDVVTTLTAIADAHGVAPGTVALAWLRTRPNVTAPVVSARTVEQLPSLLDSATLDLPAADLAALDEVSARVPE